MSKQVNVEEAASWSKEEYEDNIAYLSDRMMWEDVSRAKAVRGGVEPQDDTPQVQDQVDGLPPSEAEEIQGMNAQQVLEWVGDDQGRANLALAIENQKEEPRKKLSERLGELANP